MNTLAELPSALAVITVTSLVSVTIVGYITFRIINVVAQAPNRAELAACLKEIAGIIRAIRRSRL